MYINPIVLPDNGIVLAQPDYEKIFLQYAGKTITVNDSDFIEKDGNKYANIKDLKHELKVIEIPGDIAEMRAQKRKEAALEKGAIFIDRSGPEPMYFYLEGENGEKLRILQGEKEITAKEINVTQGHKTVCAEGLDLGYSWLILPGEVLKKWEPMLEAKRLKKLALIPASDSLTDCKKYYKLNMCIPSSMWSKISNQFINWGEPEGWVTCEPGKVADILKIPIE